jgi:type II secretory pathway component PulF
MLFSQQLPLAALVEICHLLCVNLSAGLRLHDVVRQLATRGTRKVRPVAARILQRLEKGDNFQDALRPESAVFPPLFLGMVDLGEQTGNLPEVLEELERYYFQQQKYRRQLRSKSTGTVVQFVIAIGVVALLIFVLGAIAESHGNRAPEVMGFRGGAGAIQFLLVCAGLSCGIYAAYQFLTRGLGQQATVDGLMLRLPVIGPCVEALVVGRFALALKLTLDSTMPLAEAVRLAFQASGNAAFARQEDAVLAGVEDGEDLTIALGHGWLMPSDFLTMAAVGEEGGRLVEIMRHQATHYFEEAGRRMQAATRLASGLIWFGYAGLMVVGIFRIAGNVIGVGLP